jgi:hypothetical protein
MLLSPYLANKLPTPSSKTSLRINTFYFMLDYLTIKVWVLIEVWIYRFQEKKYICLIMYKILIFGS